MVLTIEIFEFIISIVMYIFLTYSCIIQYTNLNNGKVLGGAILYATILILILVKCSFYEVKATKKVHREAVEKGHAEFVINERGENIFMWK